MTLTKLQIVSASKKTMAVALGSSLPTPADATTAATTAETTTRIAAATAATILSVAVTTAVAAIAVATAAVAPIEDDLEDPLDVVLASALEGR